MSRFAGRFSSFRLAVLLVSLLLTYVLVNTIGNAIHNYRLERERSQLEQEIAALQQQYEQLLAIEAYVRSDEYIEFVARRVLGYSRPGESTAIVISPGDTRQPRPLRSPEQAWWESLFER